MRLPPEEGMMARAVWQGVVLAETSRPVLLEGNVYFPPADVRSEYLTRTRAWTVCPWKGVARYYTVRAGGRVNKNAAWYYPHPSPLARAIKNHVAFWRGVQVGHGTAAPAAPPSPAPAPLALANDRQCGLTG